MQAALKQNLLNYFSLSNEKDPFQLYNEIVNRSDIPMHGPIHHFIIPAALLTCYNNILDNPKEVKDNHLKIAFERSTIVPGAFCANFGACGAGLGVGIFFSVIMDNTPLSEESWSKVITVTSKAQSLIAKNGGPRCCKRDSYLSLIVAVGAIKEIFTMDIKYDNKIRCSFSNINHQCKKEKCLFYNK